MKQIKGNDMLTKLTEVIKLNYQSGNQYTLREIYVNPASITMITIETQMKNYLIEGLLPDGIDKRTEFSRVTINSGTHHPSLTVVGSPEIIESKLHKSRQLLKG